MKRHLADNAKNLLGWRSAERLVVFSVDDYGCLRLASREAGEALAARGVAAKTHFDRLDAVESRADLEALFDVLSSVTDAGGQHAVMTPYALCTNPDVESMRRRPELGYQLEPITRTFDRLAAAAPSEYGGTWSLWQEGMERRLLRPQFHGREHVNVDLVERKLHRRDRTLMANLEHDSMIALGEEPSMPGVGFTEAYGLWDRAEIEGHRERIRDGLRRFREIFGRASASFTPPACRLHPDLYAVVEDAGVKAIDKPMRFKRRLHRQRHRREVNVLGRRWDQNHITLVRNVMFEPTRDGDAAAPRALQQVEAAFRWRKPAIISSHRVNFGGVIDEDNRRRGLLSLKQLLTNTVERWPDVRFIGADELVDRMAQRP